MTTARKFDIILIAQENGTVAVQVPALPEVNTQGKDRAQAMERATEVIELAIEQRIADGDDVPESLGTEIERVTIEAAA